jgi:hypothetical protein
MSERAPRPTPETASQVFFRELVQPSRRIYPYLSGVFSGESVAEAGAGRTGKALTGIGLAALVMVSNAALEPYFHRQRTKDTNK